MTTYWQQYQLSFDPFMTEQSNDVAYKSSRYEQQLDLLVHLANNENKIQLVTGLTGIGKSTMMRLLLKELNDASGICKVHGGATIMPDVLQELIARHLGIKVDVSQMTFYSQALQAKISKMRQNQENFFLVIDNAHKLPKGSLAFLIELMKWQANSTPSVHIILFGGPQLEATFAELTSTAMGEHLTHTIRLESLNEVETREYIEHRLTLAGWEEALPFTDIEMNRIVQASRGIPSKINYIAKQIMQQKMQRTKAAKGSQKSKMGAGKQLLIGGVAVLAAFATIELYQNYFLSPVAESNKQALKLHAESMVAEKPLQTSFNQAQEKAEGLTQKDTPENKHWPDFMSAKKAKNAALSAAQQQPVAQQLEPVKSEPAKVKSEFFAKPLPKPTPVNNPQRITQSEMQAIAKSDIAQPEKTVTPVPAQSAPVTNNYTQQHQTDVPAISSQKTFAAAPANAEVAKSEDMNITAQTVQKPVVAVQQVQSRSAPSLKVQTADTVAPQQTKASTQPAALKSVKAPKPIYTKDELYLLSKSNYHYAIQLAGAYDIRYLRQHFSKIHLNNNIRFFETDLNGKPWYVVVYGDYPSEASARKAITQLPSSLRNAKPWPRSYKNIQRAIKANQ